MLNKFISFWEYINNAEYITLCTHVEPDGDTLGSAIALKELILLNSRKTKEVKISGNDYPRNLLFLSEEKIDFVNDDYFNKSLKIVVDTSTPSRIADKRVKTENSLKLDHHHKEAKWLFEIGGDNWPATGQLIVQMIKLLNLKVNNKVLEAAAVAILSDTEFFRERNISSETFESYALLLDKGLQHAKLLKSMALNNDENQLIFNVCSNKQVEGIVSYIISQETISNDIVRPLVGKFVEISNTEVQLAVLKRTQGNYRCEIRSKELFDVSIVAKHFKGGGHYNSAGFMIDDLEELKNVIQYINHLKN
ncbi:DHH family phosphoesterase [Mycoplasma phocoenae]|uniref:Phosphoesterase n=1 Tax=Mycoplasma phocoenae TaxID=754517 RepID=A0A858U6M5_9MOLU|nr:DHH family phosphoesterase [Mycoplasma phocoenae]QJG66915.1 phosphoesterase [Mycoplasma phocoenae]